MIDWLAMGGYAGYVWASYGATLVVICIEVAALAKRRRRALERAQAEWETGNGD